MEEQTSVSEQQETISEPPTIDEGSHMSNPFVVEQPNVEEPVLRDETVGEDPRVENQEKLVQGNDEQAATDRPVIDDNTEESGIGSFFSGWFGSGSKKDVAEEEVLVGGAEEQVAGGTEEQVAGGTRHKSHEAESDPLNVDDGSDIKFHMTGGETGCILPEDDGIIKFHMPWHARGSAHHPFGSRFPR